MRLSGCHVELDVADLKVGVLFEDARPQLKKWHDQTLQQHLEVWLIRSTLPEVIHDRLSNHKQQHILKLVHVLAARVDLADLGLLLSGALLQLQLLLVARCHLLCPMQQLLRLLVDLSQKGREKLARSFDEVVRCEIERLVAAPAFLLFAAVLLSPVPLALSAQTTWTTLLVTVCLAGLAIIVTHHRLLLLLVLLVQLIP